MDSLDDRFREPNGPAHQARQTRVGPPLEYVVEKLAATLGDLHRAVSAAQATGGAGAAVHAAFVHALVAYLALGNMLAVAEDPGALATRLLALSLEDFEDWRWRVGQEMSVTG